MTRYTIDIDDEVYKTLRKRAIDEDRSVSVIIRELIDSYLGQDKEQPTRKGEKKFPGQWDVAVQKKGAERPSKK